MRTILFNEVAVCAPLPMGWWSITGVGKTWSAWMATLASLPANLAPSPEDRLMALQTLQLIDAALDRLNPKARQAFLLS
jgi:hypothetical protein